MKCVCRLLCTFPLFWVGVFCFSLNITVPLGWHSSSLSVYIGHKIAKEMCTWWQRRFHWHINVLSSSHEYRTASQTKITLAAVQAEYSRLETWERFDEYKSVTSQYLRMIHGPKYISRIVSFFPYTAMLKLFSSLISLLFILTKIEFKTFVSWYNQAIREIAWFV